MWTANIIYETVLENLDFVPSEECIEVKFVCAEGLNDLSITSNLREFGKYFDPKNHVK